MVKRNQNGQILLGAVVSLGLVLGAIGVLNSKINHSAKLVSRTTEKGIVSVLERYVVANIDCTKSKALHNANGSGSNKVRFGKRKEKKPEKRGVVMPDQDSKFKENFQVGKIKFTSEIGSKGLYIVVPGYSPLLVCES